MLLIYRCVGMDSNSGSSIEFSLSRVEQQQSGSSPLVGYLGAIVLALYLFGFGNR